VSLYKALLRIAAVGATDLVDVLRRPAALLSIVLGPFLILAVFGLGFVGPPPIRTELVIPSDAGLPTDLEDYRALTGPQVELTGIGPDHEAARARLRARAVDMIVVVPPDTRTRLEAGEQVVLAVEYDSVSPYWQTVSQAAADRLAAAVNQRVIETVLVEARDAAERSGGPLPPAAAPRVLSAPTRAEVTDLAPTPPTLIWFYGIAVIALIVQHLAVTISAISIVRDRRRGVIDMLRISPIRASELLLGKVLALTVVAALVALVAIAVLAVGFQTPLLATPSEVALATGLLIAAAIGIGLLIALVSDTDRQAIQLSLLVLLASVFFSGLALDLSHFSPAVRAGADLLPTTHATALLQDLFLRGEARDPWRLAALALIAGTLFAFGWWRLRRELSTRG
jgi:ABC-2 type transport system permease protein